MREWGGVREMAFDGVLEGRSGGEGQKGRERERDMDSLRYRERGSVKVCI